MTEWMSKQMSGNINSFIVIEARGLQACRQQQRRKEIRFMSHVTE